jgi:hypothetical protein
MTDDDDDFLLLDMDEPQDPDTVMNWLVIPPRCKTSEELNEREEQYRRDGHPPLLFVEQDEETGQWRLENAPEFAAHMGLAPGTPVTEGQALAWIDRWTVNGRWMYWAARGK